MNKFDEAIQILLHNVNSELGYNISLEDMLMCNTETELNSFITGYLIGSKKYEPKDDVFGYIQKLKTQYPNLGKFSSH